MILDTSAVIAIIRGEQDADPYTLALAAAGAAKIATPTALELALVAGPDRADEVDYFLQRSRTQVVPFDGPQLAAARQAHARYGRGSGSPARLTFGDCFSYALAKVSGEPLLFKGTDFQHTDIEPALPPLS